MGLNFRTFEVIVFSRLFNGLCLRDSIFQLFIDVIFCRHHFVKLKGTISIFYLLNNPIGILERYWER